MAKSDHISLEPLLNERLVQGASGTTVDSELSLTDGVAKAFSPTAGATQVQIFNDSGVAEVRYGGASIAAGKGGKLFSNQTMVLQNPKDDLVLYFFQNSGGDIVLDVVEFF